MFLAYLLVCYDTFTFMMRITKIADTSTTTILNVAGKIIGQDVLEIENICLEKLEQDKKVFLNFNDVTFVDKHSAML